MEDATAEAWARDELAALIAIPSPSGCEHEIVRVIAARAHALGLPTRLVATPGGADNVVVGGRGAPLLAVVAHVDTVVPSWESDRQVEIAGHEVAGLGAVDDKGAVVACLLALRLLHDDGVDLTALPAVVAFSVDEEHDGTGSSALACALRPAYAVALEGTLLQPATVECGFVGGWLDVAGVGSHGACPEVGENAVLAAARLLAALAALELAPAHPLVGDAAFVPFEIAGGSSLYAVPDACRIRFGVRLVPGLSAARTIAELERVAALHGASLTVDDTSEPFETPAASPLLERLAAEIERVTGAPAEPCGMPCWTDAHSFVDLAGSQALVFGPGDLRVAHRPDERIDVRQIVACARILAGLLGPASLAQLGEAPRQATVASA